MIAKMSTEKYKAINARAFLSALNVPQAISITGFIIVFITIWIHLEMRIAEINADITILKSEIRNPTSDIRHLKSEIRNPKSEINASGYCVSPGEKSALQPPTTSTSTGFFQNIFPTLCCYSVASQLLPNYFLIASLLVPYWFPIASLLPPYCFPIASLLVPYCFPIASLLLPYCFSVVFVFHRQCP